MLFLEDKVKWFVLIAERKRLSNLHGSLCKLHFLHYFEEKVFQTIKKYRLIDSEDKLCVAASGGKDS